jgi:SAM-dependent methyltransferase
LSYPNNFFDAVICLGVVEHFEQGATEALRELYRVLKSRGVLFVSVPYINPLRRITGRISYKYKRNVGEEFYQHLYSRKEFTKILQEMGFQIIDFIPYDADKGLKDEIHMIVNLFKKNRFWHTNSKELKPIERNASIGHGDINNPAKRKVPTFYNVLCGLKQSCRRVVLKSKSICLLAGHMMMFVATKR